MDFFLLLDLPARMLAYVNVMFVIIDFIRDLRIVLSSYFRERCYLHQLTRQVQFNHAFIPMFLLHLMESLQQSLQ